MKSALLIVLALATLAGAATASAQTIEDRLRQQLESTNEQIRQLQDAQASLQAQKLAAEQERDALKKRVAELQGEVSRARHETSGPSEASVAKYKEAVSEASEKAAQSATARDQVQATAAKQAKILEACEAKNDQMAHVTHEVIEAYQNLDFSWDDAARDAFLDAHRAKIENAAQAYEDALRDAQFDVRTALPPPAQAGGQKDPSGKTP